ncbi:hypothetical protein ACWC9S_27200 [Streptomyces xiamenensis]
MTSRRPLRTGRTADPAPPPPAADPAARRTAVERVLDELDDQEHGQPGPDSTKPPAPGGGRRPLGNRGNVQPMRTTGAT